MLIITSYDFSTKLFIFFYLKSLFYSQLCECKTIEKWKT